MLRQVSFLTGWLCSVLLLGGCVSPIALHRAVIEYDRTVHRVTNELLLLNIARSRHYRPVHFTAVSSVAATFDFRTTTEFRAIPFNSGLVDPQVELSMGATAAENPTITILPIAGQEFTERILQPISESKLQFLGGEGINPALMVRLVARGIQLDGYGEEGLLLNTPTRVDEYKEFRRRVLHLSSLERKRKLYFEPVRYIEEGELVTGRSAVTNYPLDEVSDAERKELLNISRPYPGNYVLVDIRPGDPGGDYPLRGAIRLRSFKGILAFIGRSIGDEHEFHVDPDPRTGRVDVNPVRTLAIRETSSRPDDALFAIQEFGKWYSVEPVPEGDPEVARWNREAFDVLQMLFQMTVTDVSETPTPQITIAK